MEKVDWKPERKIVGAAIATLVVFAAQVVFPDIEVPPGVEGAIAVLVGYFVPG